MLVFANEIYIRNSSRVYKNFVSIKKINKLLLHRYLSKLQRISIFGIEVDEKVELDKSFDVLLPDVFIYDYYVHAVSLSSINTSRTHWIVGSINLCDSDCIQKCAMRKDKEKLSFLDWNLFNADNINKRLFSVIALCSIGADEWCDKTRALHNNLSEVFKGIEFDYLLRGSQKGYISLDEKGFSLDVKDSCFDYPFGSNKYTNKTFSKFNFFFLLLNAIESFVL